MSTVDLDAIRKRYARYVDATWDEEDGLARDLADEVPALVDEVEQLRRAVMDEMAERDAALVEVERLRQLYADHRAIIEALAAEVARLRANQGDPAAALDDMAERIGRGPAIPLPPSVYSALIRERAEDLRAAVSTGDGTGDTDG